MSEPSHNAPAPVVEQHHARRTPFVGREVELARLKERFAVAASGDDFAAYEMGVAHRAAEYLRRVERHGRDLEELERDEIAKLVGHAADDPAAAEEALETWVRKAGTDRDAELVVLLHRRATRREALLQPVLRELEGASIQLL